MQGGLVGRNEPEVGKSDPVPSIGGGHQLESNGVFASKWLALHRH